VATPTNIGKPITKAKVRSKEATVLLKTDDVKVIRHIQKIEFNILNKKPSKNHLLEMASEVSNITIDEMKVMAKVKRNRASLSST
jgi:hypothetical protein